MKKVMFMTNSLDGGGAEKILQTILMNLDHNKYDMTLYSMHREDIKSMEYPANVCYKVIFDEYTGKQMLIRILDKLYLKIKGKIFQKCSAKLFYKLFIHEKYDVEIAFIEGESTKIISGSSNKKSKKYAWVHIDLEKNPWTQFMYKNALDEEKHYRKFDKIMCVSESVRDAFLDKYNGIDTSKVLVQYNPIDREKIITMSKSESIIKKQDKFRMVAVGRLVEQKGFDRLMEVCANLRDDGFEFEVIILGEGKERTKLEMLINSLQLLSIVKLPGYLSNPYSVMRTADLIVCSSRSEGFSTVLTEAMVLGVPIVSTECAGVKELFGDMKCGMIVENSTLALYQSLKQVLINQEKLAFYKANSIKRGSNFNLIKVMNEIQEILDS